MESFATGAIVKYKWGRGGIGMMVSDVRTHAGFFTLMPSYAIKTCTPMLTGNKREGIMFDWVAPPTEEVLMPAHTTEQLEAIRTVPHDFNFYQGRTRSGIMSMSKQEFSALTESHNAVQHPHIWVVLA